MAESEFVRVQDDCIRATVRMQEEIGFEVATDGEFRRDCYWGRFVELHGKGRATLASSIDDGIHGRPP
jgi:methionine synthase II (cobalamin-independent)